MIKFLQSFTFKFIFPFLILCAFVSSCREIDVFEKNISIPNMQWNNSYNAAGTFLIKDTNSTYNIFLVLRHTDAYAYNNIWLNIGLQAPGDSSLKFQKINLALGNDAQGWEGIGMNDIWEVRKLISGTPKKFIRSGTYNFSIAQLMRDNPLLHIISAGISVQKAK